MVGLGARSLGVYSRPPCLKQLFDVGAASPKKLYLRNVHLFLIISRCHVGLGTGPALQSVLEKPLVIFLLASIPSATLVCAGALLISLTATGEGLSTSGVERSMALLTNMAQFSTHAKAAFNPTSRTETGRLSAEQASAVDITTDETTQQPPPTHLPPQPTLTRRNPNSRVSSTANRQLSLLSR